MVALVVRLRLAILRNGLRRSPWQVVGLVVACVYGLFGAFVVVGGMVAASVADAPVRAQATVVAGAVLVLGWWVVPLVAFGVDGTLDPGSFTTFAIPRRTLLLGLAVAGLVGVPGALTTVSALSIGAAWWRDPSALVVAVIGAALGLATAVVGSRALVASAGRVMAGRRAREALAGVVALVVVGVVLAVSRVPRVMVGVDRHTFDGIARVVGWTPVGAAWAAPADVADGHWIGAAGHVAIALATLAMAAWGWDRAVASTVVAPPHAGAARGGRGLGWFDRLPATPLGAVVARCATYWVRDPRYLTSLVMIPAVPAVLWALDRDGTAVLWSGPVAALLLGWGISADVSYDGKAFWTHAAAPLPGAVDRLGRVLGAATVAVPLLVAVTLAGALVAHRPGDVVAVLGAGIGVLTTAYGGASVASAVAVFPVQQPGENPFQTKQGTSLAVVVAQLAGWSVVAVAAAPEIALAVVAHASGSRWAAVGAVVVGLGLGGLLLAVGVRAGGRLLERRAPELVEKVLSFA